MNYYLAWIHFDNRGRMSTRLPDGHRILEVLHNSGSNRHPPALWVLIEAVVATPSYTPAAGFPAAGEMPEGYRTPAPMPAPARHDSGGWEYREPERETTDAGQNGMTRYPELSPDARDDDYRTDSYIPGIPMSPANSRM